MAQHPVFNALENGTPVITGNDRLARHLADQYATQRIAAGDTAWTSPKLMSWQAFLNDLAEQCLFDQPDAPKRLGAAAATTLWETVILDSRSAAILQPRATARSLQEAWQSLHAALLDEAAVDADTADSEAFVEWASEYRQRCEQGGFVDMARLPDLLSQQLASGRLDRPGGIVLAGFLELTPQQKNFLAAWEAAGGEWRQEDPLDSGPDSNPVAAEFANARQECIAIASWTREILTAEPNARIGIVVPELATMRGELQRQLTRHLLPTSRLAMPGIDPPFNFSAGFALRDYAMISDALLLLALGERIDIHDASRLLRSPFIGSKTERDHDFLRLDSALKKSGAAYVDARAIAALAKRHAVEFSRRLDAVLSARARLAESRSPGHWARAFSDDLKTLGWSSGRTLNSDEFQLREAWYELLGEFSSLDAIVPRLDRARALAILGRLATERVFQPKSDTAPVQVLGQLESIGLQFDHLWVMGLNDTNWPQSARPNPFLPVRLQRDNGMPHASAQREREFALRMMHSFASCSSDVVFSYPVTDEDRLLRPSPLLAGMKKRDFSEQAPDPLAVTMLAAELETFNDDKAPPLADDELRLGGTAVLTDMAACPFKAFATSRLRAKDEPQPDSGLNAAERGELLHALLKGVWDELGDQQALLKLSAARKEAMVGRHVELLLQERFKPDSNFSAIFLESEAIRLARLVLQWLDMESTRPAFRVAGTELQVEMQVGPLALRGRIDRIDELDGGGKILIDYKTGRASINQWSGERPDAPQLPLYAVTGEEFPEAIAFARLKAGENNFEALAKRDNVLPDATLLDQWKKRPEPVTTWDELGPYWRGLLESLAAKFADGVATVDPKNVNQSCRYCHLSTLCRIDEKSQSRRGFVGETDDE